MRRLTIIAMMFIMSFWLAGSALAHEGGHGPCTGGAPAALPFFGIDVAPGPEFGKAVSVLATGPDTAAIVEMIHSGFCDSNTPAEK